MLSAGWTSPTEVKQIHDVLEGLALLFFAALVVFEAVTHFTTSKEKVYTSIGLCAFAIAVLLEIVAYPYSRRNDELSGAAFLKQQKEIAELTEANGKLQLQIAQANKDAADANRKAEDDHLARVKIENRFADRVLTATDITGLVTTLKPFSGQQYTITTYPDMREPLHFSHTIYDTLNKAHWGFVQHESATMLLGGKTGVEVWIHPSAEESTKTAANLLVSLLTKDHISSQLKLQGPTNNPKHEKIELVIGMKPD